MARKPQPRGALILVILSMLALFTLIVLTLVLVAGQYRAGAKSDAKVEQRGDDPKKLLDDVFYQLARGTWDRNSVLYDHDLLGDLYGADGGWIGEVATCTYLSGSAAPTQFWEIVVDNGQLNKQAGYYNGQVLTLVGNRTILAMRVVGYTQNGTRCHFRAMPLDTVDPSMAPPGLTAPEAFVGARAVLNGRPLNGYGFGYDPASTAMPPATRLSLNLQMNGVDYKYALLPNHKFAVLGVPTAPDEDHDAPTPQDMLLAFLPLEAGMLGDAGAPQPRILPSLHRPDLIEYWRKDATFATTNYDLQRAVLMRPLAYDHPNFDGSNPGWNPLSDPWAQANGARYDIDNDGDGRYESVWVDVGLPVTTAPDGRKYKPLAAILCTDMDGRLNLNAHGSLAQVHFDPAQPSPVAYGGEWIPGTQPTTPLPVGQGFGPAEISLVPVFGDVLAKNLMMGLVDTTGASPRVVEGRYGETTLNENPLKVHHAGHTGSMVSAQGDLAGNNALLDILSGIQHFELPAADTFDVFGSYGSPADAVGARAVVLDLRGSPYYANDPYDPRLVQRLTWSQRLLNESLLSPYKLNLSYNAYRSVRDYGAVDNPFSPSELERILRAYDADAGQLPFRILDLLGVRTQADADAQPGGANSPTVLQLLRQAVTTDSWSLPVPSLALLPPSAPSAGNLGNTPIDLASAYLTNDYPAWSGLSSDDRAKILRDLLPDDLMMGLRFNVNRPLGNGRDDNNNYVVDEPDFDTTAPQESGSELFLRGNSSPLSLQRNVPFDHANSGTPNSPAGALRARQRMARYLYVLALALHDKDSIDVDGDGPSTRRETARAIAQWAINAVDFRDPDSIMTPFEYDLEPFTDNDNNPANGTWDVDDNLTSTSTDNAQTWRGLVWGCERPELIFSEVLALHDRRSQDTNEEVKDATDPEETAGDGENPGRTTDLPAPGSKEHDVSFDQKYLPQGSLFFELYNPWSLPDDAARQRAELPWELYRPDPAFPASSERTGVALDKVAPADQAGKIAPVWRVLVASGDSSRELRDPDDVLVPPINPATRFRLQDVERVVYFVDKKLSPSLVLANPNVTGDPLGRNVYFPGMQGGTSDDNPQRLPTIPPGKYLVVGPGKESQADRDNATRAFVTPLGKRKSQNPGVYTDTQRIVLRTHANPPAGNVYWGAEVATNPTSDPGGNPTIPPVKGEIKENFAIVVNYPRRLSISEPTPSQGWYTSLLPPGAKIDTKTTLANEDTFVADPGGAPLVLDVPLDKKRPALERDVVMYNGTHQNARHYRTLYLQRLANPLAPYHRDNNPYLTIDRMPVALTAFNGFDDGDDPHDAGPAITGIRSTQRDGSNSLFGYPKNLWTVEPPRTADAPTPTFDADHVLDRSLRNSLGYLNNQFKPAYGRQGTPLPAGVPVKYLGDPFVDPNDPNSHPFPWLTWNNRPYVSPLELLLVPGRSSSKLLVDYTMANNTNAAGNSNPGQSSYTTDTVGSAMGTKRYTAGYGHLLNFLHSEGATASQLHRIFDYLGVPSPFAGTETYLDPEPPNTAALSDPTTPSGGNSLYQGRFHPPFGKVSAYRDPGRVNVNTIPSRKVWEGIMHGDPADTQPSPLYTPHRGPKWQDVAESRGVGGTPSSAWPSYFSNPFRSASGFYLRLPDAPDVSAEIDVTLLRRKAKGNDDPLFANDVGDPVLARHRDPNRNPYFRYQPMIRLNNLLTTHSNVYAVWITIGYFEVEPGPIDPAHPDGYRLGQELGIESGEVKRHRAFYLFDRSIPVGYERGQNLNLERALLLRRMIE